LFYITYNNNRFEIKIKSNDRDEFSDYIDFLQSIFIAWDKTVKVWHYKVERFKEMQLWYERRNIDVSYCDKCFEIYNEYEKTFIPKVKFRRNVELDFSILNEGINLFEFQKKGVEFCLSRSRSFLGDSAGVGKTIQSIFIFSQLYKEGKVNGIFIVVKTGLSYQ
jgi:SNF2 family DNA or RNA helicase